MMLDLSASLYSSVVCLVIVNLDGLSLSAEGTRVCEVIFIVRNAPNRRIKGRDVRGRGAGYRAFMEQYDSM